MADYNFEGLGCLVYGGIVWFFVAVILAGFTIYGFFFEKPVIKSKSRIVPVVEYRTDGKTIDSVYVYKLK